MQLRLTRWQPWMGGLVAFALAAASLVAVRVATGDAWCVCYAFIFGCWYSARIVFGALALGLVAFAGGFGLAVLMAALHGSPRLRLLIFAVVAVPIGFVALDQLARGFVEGLFVAALLIPGVLVVSVGKPAARTSGAVALGLLLGSLVPSGAVFFLSTC